MGYRSDITFVLLKSDYEELVNLMEPVSAFGHKELTNNVKYMTTPDETYARVDLEQWKWYSSYPEVALINKFLARHRHSLVIIGEEVDDIVVDNVPNDEWGCDEEFEYMLWVDRVVTSDFVEDEED